MERRQAMSHDLDIRNDKASMMYVGEKPWHGLGQYLGEQPITADEAIVAAQLDWRVTTEPIFLSDHTNVEQYKAIIREDTGDVLSVARRHWMPLQNEDAFKVLDPFIGEGKAVWHTAGAISEGKTIWVLAKLPDTIQVIGNDTVDQYFLLTNSHRPGKAIRIRFTPVRVVCQNTLQMALLSEGGIVRVPHLKNHKQKLEEAAQALGLVKLVADQFQATAQAMTRVQMTDSEIDEFLKELLQGKEETDEKMANYANMKAYNRARELVETGAGTDIPGIKGTLWGTYNAVTELVDHTDKKVANMANYMWFGAGADLKNKAWTRAESILRKGK